MLYPVISAKEIWDNVQLKARDFWTQVNHDEMGETLIYPGSLFVLSGQRPGIHRAPLPGEHNGEVYCGELGFSRGDLVILKQTGII